MNAASERLRAERFAGLLHAGSMASVPILAILLAAAPAGVSKNVHAAARDQTVVSGAVRDVEVPPEFFGMHLAAQTREGWPSTNFSIQRTWDSWPGVSWNDLNPAPGVYEWSTLDGLVADSLSHGVDLVYTFGHVPRWASTNPDIRCEAMGDCYPPRMDAWIEFVAKISERYKGRIRYWEIWNEPNAPRFWRGSTAQLVDMARAAAPILRGSGGKVLSPSAQGASAPEWLDRYLELGGGAFADVLAFHGYLHGPPELLLPLVEKIRAVQKKHHVESLAIWDTEHSWGDKNWPMGSNPADQSAWIARFLLLSFSTGIERSFWYGWDHYDWGSLFDRKSRRLLEPGIAYGVVTAWMLGSRFNGCSARKTIYQCAITRKDSHTAIILWSTAGNPSFEVPPGFEILRTLDGGHSNMGGTHTIRLGAQPVLLEKLSR